MPAHWHFNGVSIFLVANIPGRTNRVGNPSLDFTRLDHLPTVANAEFEGERLERLRGTYQVSLEHGESRPMTVLECFPANRRSKARARDARKLRDDFLGLKEDTAVLLEFLNYCGAWEDSFYLGQWFAERDLGSESEKRRPSFTVSPYYFWEYRRLLRRRLEDASREPASWFASTITPPALERIPEYPFHSFRIAYTLQAIEASFTIDLLKQVPMSLCARENCRKPYFVTRNGKIFCSEKCARCMVSWRARAKERVEQSKG